MTGMYTQCLPVCSNVHD